MIRWASSSIRLANAVCVMIGLLTSTTNLLQTTQHLRLRSKPVTMYSKPPCGQWWMAPERSTTHGTKSLPHYVGSSSGNRVILERGSISYRAGSWTTFKMSLVVCMMISWMWATTSFSPTHPASASMCAHLLPITWKSWLPPSNTLGCK